MKKNIRSEKGASMIEYALLAALVAVVSITAVAEAGIGTHDAIARSGWALARAGGSDSSMSDGETIDDPCPTCIRDFGDGTDG